VSVVATGIEAEVGAQPAPAKVFSFPARQPAVSAPAPDASETPDTDAIADEDGGDELLLDADDILTSPVGSPPIAPPADEEDNAQATGTTGGTLFERMSNIARGAPKAQIDEEDTGYRREPIDIPRFLNRQNNQ